MIYADFTGGRVANVREPSVRARFINYWLYEMYASIGLWWKK